MRKPVCKFCGGEVKYGNLFCTVACAKDHEKRQVFHEDQLKANGFEQHPDIPNAYRKGGVSVTLERIHHVGLEKGIEHHGHVRIDGVAQGEPGDADAVGEGAEGNAGTGAKAAGIA